MANNCNYEMKVNGKKEDLEKFISYITADYNYKNDELEMCTADKHFSRIFEAEVYDNYDLEEDGTTVIYGYCAWSVYSCMFAGDSTYYDQLKTCKNSKVTNMVEASKELNLEVEIFSEESGCGFMEHFIVKYGEILVSDCIDYEETYDEETDETTTTGGIEWNFEI